MYYVTINGQFKTFHHANELRLYVARYGDKNRRYIYDGHGPHYSHNRGIMWYDKRWLVETYSNKVYRLDRQGNLK